MYRILAVIGLTCIAIGVGVFVRHTLTSGLDVVIGQVTTR